MPRPTATMRLRRLILVFLGFAVAAVAYLYSDALIDFAASVTGGKLGHARGHVRY